MTDDRAPANPPTDLHPLERLLLLRERTRNFWRRRFGRRPLPGMTVRLIDPQYGQAFVFAGRPHGPFIRHPRSGSIMRVSTYARLEGERKAASAVRAALVLQRRAERQERRARP